MAGVAASLSWTDEQFEIFANKNEQFSEIWVHFCDTGRLFCPINVFWLAAACIKFAHMY